MEAFELAVDRPQEKESKDRGKPSALKEQSCQIYYCLETYP